jgi:hypothetical protein
MQGPSSFSITSQLIVFSGAQGTGIFLYNGTPGAGNPPILSAVAPGVTLDPFGNTVQAVLVIGALAGAHVQFDQTGSFSLYDSSDHKRLAISTATGRIQFYNAFGATTFLIAADLGALFFYQDLGSATQGGTIGCESWSLSNVTDPVNLTVFTPGFTSFDPVAAGFLSITPGNINLGNAASMSTLCRMSGIGGVTSARGFLALAGPSAAAHGSDPHAIVQVAGTSPDETNGPQVFMGPVVAGANGSPLTTAFLEITGGPVALADQAGVPAVTAGFSTMYSAAGILTLPGELDPHSMNIPANAGKHLGVDSSGLLYLIKTLVTDLAALAELSGDANERWHLLADGTTAWGPGSAATDTTMNRDGVNSLLLSGQLNLKDISAPGTPAGKSSLFSATGNLKYVSEDGSAYATGRDTRTGTTAGQTFNSVTATSITGMGTWHVGVGAYKITGQFIPFPAQSAGAAVFTMGGTATTGGFNRVKFWMANDGAAATIDTASLTAMGGTVTGPTFVNATDQTWRFEGVFNFTVAGTVIPEMSCTVAADTYQMRGAGGWYFQIEPIV